tara:strand:+ start:967 stop:1296 length:330 start_codon:yes stop_codon:yes gene_type:complete
MSENLVLTRDQIIEMLQEGSWVIVYDTNIQSNLEGRFSLYEEDLPQMTPLQIKIKEEIAGNSWADETDENRASHTITGIACYDVENACWVNFNCSRLRSIGGIPVTYSS